MLLINTRVCGLFKSLPHIEEFAACSNTHPAASRLSPERWVDPIFRRWDLVLSNPAPWSCWTVVPQFFQNIDERTWSVKELLHWLQIQNQTTKILAPKRLRNRAQKPLCKATPAEFPYVPTELTFVSMWHRHRQVPCAAIFEVSLIRIDIQTSSPLLELINIPVRCAPQTPIQLRCSGLPLPPKPHFPLCTLYASTVTA